jgi:ankyrin repeat protein
MSNQVLDAWDDDSNIDRGLYITELSVATAEGDLKAIRKLLDKGALVDETNSDDTTPLHLACGWSSSSDWSERSKPRAEIVATLLDHGADLTIPINHSGGCVSTTAIHLASGCGYTEIVRVLLDRGAAIDDLDYNDRGPKTPLHAAIRCGHEDVVRLLLDRGASIHAKNGQDGMTALHYAAGGGWYRIAQLLLDHGATIYLETEISPGITPLVLSLIGAGDYEEPLTTLGNDWRQTMQLFFEHGAILPKKSFGLVMTSVAQDIKDAKSLIPLLIEKGIDIDSVNDNDERTALHIAA